MATRTKHPKDRFCKIARIRDQATQRVSEMYECPVSPNECARLEISPSIARDPRRFSAELRDRGALLPQDDKVCGDFLKSLAKSKSEHKWAYAAQTGWLNDDWQSYVEFYGAIGNGSAEIIGVKRSDSIHDATGKISKVGTVASWRCIAERAQSSSIFMLAICAAFGAPLLSALGQRSFGINLFGPARAGKTTATLLGASVRGFGKVDDLISWGITDARLQQRLPEFNDSLLPVEDLMKLGGTDRQKFKRVQSFAYVIEQGHQTAHHSSFTEQHGGAHRPYRTILLTSSEHSIGELAESAHSARLAGEAVRLMDVPVLLGGREHMFDRVAPMDAAAFLAWRAEQFSAIPALIANSHGAVFNDYIQRLIKTGRDKIASYAQSRVAEFKVHVSEEADGDVARDAAAKFGVLYAAGRIAMKLGLLTWSADDCLDAIAKCYLAARELLPDPGVALRRAIVHLLDKLKSLPELRSLSGHVSYEALDGYRETKGDTHVCVLKCEAYNSIFGSAGDRERILEWLVQKRRITLARPKSGQPGDALQQKKQFAWPDGERRRSFEIHWPVKRGGAAA